LNKIRFTFLDIETSPLVGYTWKTWDATVLKVLQQSQVISVAWKDLEDNDVTVKCLNDYKGYKPGKLDDEKLITEVWEVLDKSDVICAHHGKAFDLKKLNTRFVSHGLSAPSHYEVVDTKQLASKIFAFDGNSLNALGQFLGVGKKIENGGFGLWERCMAGDPEAWEVMKEYNAQDVRLLQEVYLKLRPFDTRHPDLALMTGEVKTKDHCSTCLSKNIQRRGFSLLRSGKKQRYQCQDCGSWSVGPYERVRANDD
jgi:uncharacterized protein YprB with RNaseH-like and TPR domain